MDLASKSIQAGEPVWFGCDVSKYFARKVGLLTMDLYDYELVFGTKVNIGLNKAERLIYGDCAMNHAMLLTAVHIEVLHSGLSSKKSCKTFFFAKFFLSCGKFIAEEEILKSFILIFEITHILSLGGFHK